MVSVPKNLVISGTPGVGKTTLIKEAVLPFVSKAGGFFTEQVLESRQRMGFLLRTFSGERGVLASKRLSSPHKVGKYGVDMNVLEGIGVRSLERALQERSLIVIDEIGSMEVLSESFRRIVVECFKGPKPVLAAIRLKAQPFTDSVKKMAGTEMVFLSRQNYISVRESVRSWIEKWLA